MNVSDEVNKLHDVHAQKMITYKKCAVLKSI